MDYPLSKTAPWSNQVKAWELVREKTGAYLAMDMGTGKSKATIDSINGLNAYRVLILCPKKVVPVWPKEFGKHSHHPYTVFAPVKGTAKQKAEKIQKLISMQPVTKERIAVVLNYDLFWRVPLGPVYNSQNRIIDPGLLLRYEWDLLVCDEAHRIKAPGGKASWGAFRMAQKSKRRILLSGTPMPSSPLDVYAQFRTLDPAIFGTSYNRFKTRYAVFGGYENRQVLRYINQDELNDKFYSVTYRVTKEEVLDLPDTVTVTRTCELDPKAMRLYNQLDQEFTAAMVAEFNQTGTISADNALVKILRLAQMAGGYVKLDDDAGEKVIDNNKIDTAIEILEDLSEDEPVVIFCRFTNEIQRLKNEIAIKTGRTVAEVSGAVNQLEEWQEGQYNVLIVQIQSGGEGIDLTRSRYCVYFSIGESLGLFNQSLSRIHRPGQTRKVTYFHILAEGTVDEKIYRALEKKQKIVDYVLDEITVIKKASGF